MVSTCLDAQIKAVYFDAVGTVLHPAAPVAQTYRIIAQKNGLELDEPVLLARLRASFAKQEEVDAGSGWRTSEEREAERWKSIVHEALSESPRAEDCFVELWEWYRAPSAWTIDPEMGNILETLTRRGLIVGMASNFDARLQEIVNGIPMLSPLRERCIISSLIGWRKPSIHFFTSVIHQSGCSAEQILFVGDARRNDYLGARAAGMQARLFQPAAGAEKGVEQIAHLSDLL